jgi:5'-3' exonuclease
MKVHLIDGTYELFRHYFALPSSSDADGREVGALVGVLASVLGLLEGGATHIAVATDHVVESFRNDLWAGYKSGEGIEPELAEQFHPLEDALRSMGVVVWAMTDLEADDALASGAALAAADPGVEQVLICTPDKDLSQCVVGTRVVQVDRRKRELRDQAGVVEKFGVMPASIPDYLALVGDSADGFPGIQGWGAKSSGIVLARYDHLEDIPSDPSEWDIQVRGAARLSENLEAGRDLAELFRTLARLKTDEPLFDSVDELRWSGAETSFTALCSNLGSTQLAERARVLQRDRAH